jgi:GNAT superfamily N-acetyltransferase
MRAEEFLTDAYDTGVFRMAKLQKDGRVVRILKHKDQVSFSDEQGWLLIDVTPGRQRPETMKWIPDTTKFDWVREFNSAEQIDEYREPMSRRAHRGGIDLEAWKDGLHFQINATSHGRELGRVVFDVQFQGRDTILVAQDLMILPEYRGQGIAAIMYDYAKELGYVVERSPEQTDAGRQFWDKNRGEEATVWENFADGKKPGRKGLSKRVGIPKKASLSKLQKIASSSTGERRRMAQWQLNMRRGKAKKK